jgi:hypothetical protein
MEMGTVGLGEPFSCFSISYDDTAIHESIAALVPHFLTFTRDPTHPNI